MGVDFYSCAMCNQTFSDCGNYSSCEECGRHFCSIECSKLDFSQYDEEGNSIDENSLEFDHDYYGRCCICSKDEANDYVLLQFLLKRSSLSREDAVKLWQEESE